MIENANKVFRDGSELIRVTGESPQQFNGVLFAVYAGDFPETVVEALRTAEQLRDLEEVDVATLSAPWQKALRIPKVSTQSKHVDDTPAEPIIEGKRGEASIKVIETRYVAVNPKFGLVSLNWFVALAILYTMICGVNKPFLGLCIGMGLLSVLYQLSALYMTGKVRHERVN